MTQATADQRAEAARLLALHTSGVGWWSDDVADRLLVLLPALLADAAALAERERADEVRRAVVKRPVPARLVLDDDGVLWRERADG